MLFSFFFFLFPFLFLFYHTIACHFFLVCSWKKQHAKYLSRTNEVSFVSFSFHSFMKLPVRDRSLIYFLILFHPFMILCWEAYFLSVYVFCKKCVLSFLNCFIFAAAAIFRLKSFFYVLPRNVNCAGNKFYFDVSEPTSDIIHYFPIYFQYFTLVQFIYIYEKTFYL